MKRLLGGACRSEQLFGLLKNVKSITRTRLIDKHFKGCTSITATEIKPDVEWSESNESDAQY
jgi:hypothetical protein